MTPQNTVRTTQTVGMAGEIATHREVAQNVRQETQDFAKRLFRIFEGLWRITEKVFESQAVEQACGFCDEASGFFQHLNSPQAKQLSDNKEQARATTNILTSMTFVKTCQQKTIMAS